MVDILLTNDDGPFGPGLCELRRALEGLGHVRAVCPDRERSGIAHAITIMEPLRVRTVRLADGSEAELLSGTPADCVKFAMLTAGEARPELAVSGPNMGINAGVDAFYSGTVAAALEARFYGARALAVSTVPENAMRAEQLAGQTLRVLRLLLRSAGPGPWAFNVNIPALAGPDPEVRLTAQSGAFPPGRYRPAEGTHGRPHYWLDSTLDAGPAPPGSDAAAVEAGCISVTPLRADLTDTAALERLRRRLPDVSGGQMV